MSAIRPSVVKLEDIEQIPSTPTLGGDIFGQCVILIPPNEEDGKFVSLK